MKNLWQQILTTPNLKFQLVAFVISMVGLYFNIKKKKCGFIIWIFGNIMWVYMNIKNNMHLVIWNGENKKNFKRKIFKHYLPIYYKGVIV